MVLLSVNAVIYYGGHFCLASLTSFLPAIIEGLGYTTVNAQLFTVVVYTCVSIGVLFWAKVADRTNACGFTLAVSTVGAVMGYAMSAWYRSPCNISILFCNILGPR